MVSIVCPIATVILVGYGLIKWKSEFKGKRYFEATYKLLKSTYRLRDSFSYLRMSFIAVNEMLPKNDEVKNYDYENTRFVLSNRLIPFADSLNEFESILPEIEALPSAGKELRAICEPIKSIIFKYRHSLNSYLQLFGNTNNMEHLGKISRDVFCQSDDDSLKKEFDDIILKLEKEITKQGRFQ